MRDSEIKQLIPKSEDGLMKNIADLIKQYRNDNIECLMLCYRRKNNEGTRTYFINSDNPYMFRVLEQLKHDILGLYSDTAEHIIEYEE